MFPSEINTAKQWQSSQTLACATPLGDEGWMCGATAMVQQGPHSMFMSPMVSQTNYGHNFSENCGVSVTVAPQQAMPATGLFCNASDATAGRPSHAFMVSEVLPATIPCPMTQFGHWTAVPPMHTAAPVEQPSSYWSGHPADPCQVMPPQGSVFSLPFAISRLNLDAVACLKPSLMPEAPTTALCTPEITPRYAPELMPELDSTYCRHWFSNASPQVVARPAELELPEHSQHEGQTRCEREGSMDEFSLCEIQSDEQGLICWDFSIHAARLIRAQRDSNGYASSDTSTAVSRSSRRRRGRRLTKSKAKSSMVILESPAADEQLIAEERKVELIHQLAAGGGIMHKAVSSLLGSVRRISLEPFGCRVLQSALEVASTAEKEALVAELHSHVHSMIASPHANFVIQKVIEVLPVKSASFVTDELATFAVEVAQHRFGCRVLCRLVEHHLCCNASQPSANGLVDELLLETDRLILNNFARHVFELILEHGNETHKHQIAIAIRNKLFYYARNRCASYVIEKALAFCNIQDKQAIVSELLTDPEQFFALAVHECGMHVLKTVIQTRLDCAQKIKELLLTEVHRLESSKYGKRLLADI